MTSLDPQERRAEAIPSRRFHWGGLLVVAVVFGAAAALTWRRWPDILVDFGTQLYIPWRLANGAVLYRDLYYFAGGPLSQYYHALLFKIFGTSLLTIIVSNVVIVLAMLWLVYRRFAAAADAVTATLIGLGIVLAFAFAQYTTIGNYNYLTPYSHEALHGLVLAIVAVMMLADWIASGRMRYAAAAGFCAGLVFLTKPDIFVALSLASLVAIIIFWRNHGAGGRRLQSVLVFGGAALVPLLGCFLLFLTVESGRESLRSTCFAFVPLLHPAIAASPFYKWCMGLDYPAWYFRDMATLAAKIVVGLAVYAAVFRYAARWKPQRRESQWLLWLLLMCPALALAFKYHWLNCGAALPGLGLVVCVGLVTDKKAVFPFLWSVFGLALLAKLGFFARIWHYGFVLAMPAFVSVVYLLSWRLPKVLAERHQVPLQPFRCLTGLVLLIGFASLANFAQSMYAMKNMAIGAGGDRILTYGPRINPGEGVKFALGWIEKNVPRDATLAVVPEGVTLNYLSRRINPTPCLFWDPNSMALFGGEKMVAAFEQSPPDYIFIVDRDAGEFGSGYFGSSPAYGADLMQWIGTNYETAYLFGEEPLRDGKFGIKILKRLAGRDKAAKDN